MRRGLCGRHYYEWFKAHRPECSVEDCPRPATSRSLCARHYQRLRNYGSPTAGPAFRRDRGSGLPRWAYWQRRDGQRANVTADVLAWVEILRADPCVYCGGPCEHIDHIDPVDRGGALTVDNLTAACARCNIRKSATPLLLFLATRERG